MVGRRIVLFLIIVSFTFNACSDSGLFPEDRVYLEIEQSNQYGALINPGSGYFVYDRDAIATIELEITPGYNFRGWQGPHKEKLVRVNSDSNKWKIKLNQDKKIQAALELEKFSLLTTNPGVDQDDVPANLKEIRLVFNNQLGITADYLIIDFFKTTIPAENLIDKRDIEIKDNQIIINLGNDYFNERYLEFGAKYELKIANRVLDKDGRSVTVPTIVFEIETVPPEAPFIGIDEITAVNELEIFWQRCKDNLKGLGDDYAVGYKIYRSINHKEFSSTPYKIMSVAAGDFSVDDIEISFKEDLSQDVDLSNIYFYKVRAVNEHGQVSKDSNIVSIDQI